MSNRLTDAEIHDAETVIRQCDVVDPNPISVSDLCAYSRSLIAEVRRSRSSSPPPGFSHLRRVGAILVEALPGSMGGTPDLFQPATGWDEWEERAVVALRAAGLPTTDSELRDRRFASGASAPPPEGAPARFGGDDWNRRLPAASPVPASPEPGVPSVEECERIAFGAGRRVGIRAAQEVSLSLAADNENRSAERAYLFAAEKIGRLLDVVPGALASSPRATDAADYDRSIHSNPDAAAWAAFFVKTFPMGSLVPDAGTMTGWFANAMMAMHDHLKSAAPPSQGEHGDETAYPGHVFREEDMICRRCGTDLDGCDQPCAPGVSAGSSGTPNEKE